MLQSRVTNKCGDKGGEQRGRTRARLIRKRAELSPLGGGLEGPGLGV